MNAVVIIVNALFYVIATLFWARFLLQACRADFYNPISQGVVKFTDAVLKPVRMIVPSWRNLDLASLLFAWLTMCLGYVLLQVMANGYPPDAFATLIVGLARAVDTLLDMYWFFLIIVVIASWVAPGNYNPALVLLHQVTEPLLAPVRRIIPSLGGLDLSVLVVFLLLVIVRESLLPTVFGSLLRAAAG